MTEYTVKDIGHQWIVYADRQSVGACADEDSALKLIAEHSAANCAARRSSVQGTWTSKQKPATGTVRARPSCPHRLWLKPIARRSLTFRNHTAIRVETAPMVGLLKHPIDVG
jgi:hypothetical protein